MPHFQNTVSNWEQLVPRLPDGFNIKAVDRGDILRSAVQIKPTIKTTLRHWADPMQQFGGNWEEKKQRDNQMLMYSRKKWKCLM